jgi:hypothetical protein
MKIDVPQRYISMGSPVRVGSMDEIERLKSLCRP